MRRGVTLLLLFALLIPRVQAEAPKYVALTFDDGPSGKYTQRLLEGLEQRGVKATFFLCGYRLETYGELAKEIRSQGHEIGLHGYSHDDLGTMRQQEIRKELETTRAMLDSCPVVNLLRAPGGSLSQNVFAAAKAEGLAVLQWSVDPEDWATRDADTICRRVLSAVSDGDVILLHDMTDASVDAALRIVDSLTAEGYRFLTVSQLAMLRLTHLRGGQRYDSFHPNL